MSEPVSDQSVGARSRLRELDGLRGIAIVAVVLSHGWVLWPMDFIDSHSWVRPFFRSGNSAVTVFLVVSGFVSYQALAHPRGLTGMQPVVSLARRVVRVAPALLVMLVALLVVAATDDTDQSSKNTNLWTLIHCVTYSYNWYVQNNFLVSRPDLGHLWYLSVDMQAFVCFAIVAYVLRRRPFGLVAALGAWYLLGVWWRFHAFDTESIWTVLNRTSTRMDAFVLGALVAAVAVHLPRDLPVYRWVATGALVAIVPTIFWCDTDPGFMGWGGTLLEVLVAAYVLGVANGAPRDAGARGAVMGHPVLLRLGAMSLVLYIWHFPIFQFVSRHATDWAWGWKVVVALAATWVIARACERLVEEPVSRVLAQPGWRQARADGLTAYVKERHAIRPRAWARSLWAPAPTREDTRVG